jgi:Domain of unknown function (DUF4440)
MNDDTGTMVDTLQDRVNQALLTGDWHTLSDLVAPDALITGPRGYVISRDSWINVHREEAYEQVRLDVVESAVHAYDATGIRFDLVESECLYHGEEIKGRFRVSQVWARDGERWQLASVQYTTAA